LVFFVLSLFVWYCFVLLVLPVCLYQLFFVCCYSIFYF